MKKYTIGVKSPNSWKKIHNLLCCDSNCEHIPNRRVTCCDEKIHSPTRGIFELDDDEADELRNHPDISWIELSSEYYLEKYPQPITFAQRWPSDVKIYRTNFTNLPPVVATIDEENRSNWAVKRVGIVTNSLIWNNSTANVFFQGGYTHTDITSNVEYTLTGKNVDIIIQDSGILQYHPEFIDSDGKSRVRDIFLDGPYYIDPDYFDNVIPGVKYTKADGRVGIATTSARDWWQNSTRRSSQFASAGTVFGVPSNYTAENVLGVFTNGNTGGLTDCHGTAAASLSAGKNFGLAFEANIWNMYGISQNRAVFIPIETQYDLMKIFHLNKPINTEISRKNPTIINGSWGYFAFFRPTNTVNYKFRGSTGSFTGSDSNINSQVLNYKDGLFNAGLNGRYQFSSSSRSLSTDEAGRELMNAGAIYVASAGNNDLRLGISLTDPDRGNYFTDGGNGTTDFTTDSNGNRLFPDGTVPIGHVQYQHPIGIGFDETTGFAPVVCVGAMDDLTVLPDGVTERKASYSNSGPGINVWAPADDTLSAGFNLPVNTYQTYPRYNDANFIDVRFNGTSAASPVTAGLLTLRLEESPSDTSWEIKNWLENHGSVLFSPSDIRFNDPVTDDTNPQYYSGQYNLSGAEKRILFNPYETTTVTPPIPPDPPNEEPPPPTPEPEPPAPEPPPALPDIVDSNQTALILEGNELSFEGVFIFGDS